MSIIGTIFVGLIVGALARWFTTGGLDCLDRGRRGAAVRGEEAA